MNHEDDFGRLINQLSHQIKRRMDSKLNGSGVTGVQGRMLHFIIDRSRRRPVFQKDVEEAFRLRRSTATGILQLLEKNELIVRETVPYDARLKSLKPTEKAAEIHEKMKECIIETESLLVKGINPEQQKTVSDALKKMSDNLGA